MMPTFLRFGWGIAFASLATAAATVVACGGTTAVETQQSRGTGGGGADAGPSCAEIDAEYVHQIELARACSPELSALQCTQVEDSQLFCPCPRMINPANGAAVSKLSDLRAAWAAQSCPPMPAACDAGICPSPSSGICVPQPQGSSAPGLCEDKY